MNSYLVGWNIEIDANDPREAALKAQQIQRAPRSIANVFDVQDLEEGMLFHVDLDVPDPFEQVRLHVANGESVPLTAEWANPPYQSPKESG